MLQSNYISKLYFTFMVLFTIGLSAQEKDIEIELLKKVEEAIIVDETREILQADTTRLREIIELSKTHKLPKVFIKAHRWIGLYNLKKADYSRALNHLQKSLNKVNNHSDQSTEKFGLEIGIANVYIKTGRLKDAENININLLSEIKEWQNNRVVNSLSAFDYRKTVLLNLGNIYFEQGKIKEAIPVIKEAITLIRRSQYTSDALYKAAKIAASSNLGSAYLFMGDGNSAKPYILENLNYVKALNNDLRKLAQCYGNLAYCEYLSKNYDTAYQYYFESIAISEQNKYPDVSLVTYKDLSDTYAEDNKWKESFKYLNKHFHLKDSLHGIAEQRNLDNLKVQFETKQKEQKIISLEQEYQLANQQRLFLIIGLLLVFLVGIFAVLYFINLNKNRKKELELQALKMDNLNRELNYKKQDIIRLVLEINKKQTLAEQLSSQTKQMEAQINPKDKAKWNTLVTLIQKHLQFTDEQKKFYENIEAINHSFYNKLKEQFPSLSKSERELCGFIKLGLSNKEISILRNVSPEAIRSSQFRLRKKLDLTSKEEIELFLQRL